MKNGTLYGAEYVNILFDMVYRNLGKDKKFKFFCFTDDAKGIDEHIQIREIPQNLTGWWAKLFLFKDGHFPTGEQVFYIDLSTVIVSMLDKIFEYDGNFAILRDFYRPDGLQSAFMSWKAGHYGWMWERYVNAGYPSVEGGDQAWIESSFKWAYKAAIARGPDLWQDLFPNDFVSYKVHCAHGIPKGAKVVKFHGVPMPHQITGGWVPNIWKIGGGSSLELEICGNTHLDKLVENIRYAMGEGIPVLESPYPEHDRHAVIVGGGPSINQFVREIASQQGDIFALNNSWKWLEKRNIKIDYQIMLDARPENAEFVPSGSKLTRLYATQCDHRVINLSKGENTLLWNSYIPYVADQFTDRDMHWYGSGSSVGIRALFLLYSLGYRNFHLYGYDSSYQSSEGHAYEQKLNHGEKTLEVVIHDRKFTAAPWMISQSQDFLEAMEYLTGKGCIVSIHGDGLLPYMARTCLVEKVVDGEFMKLGQTYWPASDIHCHFATHKTLDDVDEIMSMVPKKGTVVQAGGNVGLWPKKMATVFNRVYTFEPEDLNYRCLVKNVTEENIIHFNAALGEEAGTIGILTDKENTGAHQVSGTGEIPVMTIDSLELEDCDLIQLDIEGYELFALKGARKTIEKFRPVIVIEFKEKLMEEYGIKPNEIADFLSLFGYSKKKELHRDIVFTMGE